MFALAAFAIAASPPQEPRAGPIAQARATVRIVSGVRLSLDGTNNPDAPAPRDSVIQSTAGPQPARLIEFE
jgi:hypothetical protein